MTFRARIWSLCAAALVALLVGRSLYVGSVELRLGREALARRDVEGGLEHLRRAAHAYLPGSPYTAGAYRELEAFAREAEARGQGDRALSAWRIVRSSALGTRWMVVPYADACDRATHRIAYWMAQQPPGPDDRDRTPAQREELLLAQLEEDRAPAPAWRLAVGLGLALWLTAAWVAAARGWDEHGRPRLDLWKRLATPFAVGMLLFLLGLSRA